VSEPEIKFESPSSEVFTPRVLVVDDELTSLSLVKRMLSRADFEVYACDSATEALKILENHHFDCIITDAIMPKMDGFELVRSLRARADFSKVPILMLTRKRQKEDVAIAVQAGVSDYVLKPVDEYLLLHKVELAIRKDNAKRRIFEYAVHEDLGEGLLSLPYKVVAISESDIAVYTGFPVTHEMPFEMSGKIFDEIGIQPPLVNLIVCSPISDATPVSEFRYESKFAFVGVQEPALKKIRGWLHKQASMRRK
jgi:CheY-like chemotaxis protein